GFYSSFMVADKVEIQTLSYLEGAEPARWVCDGSTEFEITEGNKSTRGTDIILYINAESEEFLKKSRIQEILDKYARFLPIPIQFGMKSETVEDTEAEQSEDKEK